MIVVTIEVSLGLINKVKNMEMKEEIVMACDDHYKKVICLFSIKIMS